MEQATAIAELRPAIEAQSAAIAAQATVVANLAHNVGETGYAVMSLDAHVALAVVVALALLLFDRVIGTLWSALRRAAGF